MSKIKHKKVCSTVPYLANRVDFAIEGDLKLIVAHNGAPVFMMDDVLLSELMRYHFRPMETEQGYQFGRVQLMIVPVHE